MIRESFENEMENYNQFIAPQRRSVPTPKNFVENGKCVFGTFDKEFERMCLDEIKNPTHAPDFLKKFKLTLWEATEIHLDEGVLLAVCCDMGVFGVVLHYLYDKRKKKAYKWYSSVNSKETIVADNLINGSRTYCNLPNERISYVNNFQDGKCHLDGGHKGDAGSIEYSFDLERISKPGIVSIPFADPKERHRPLYSQKDFFRCTGTLTINGETFHTTETSTAIVDDHKGYYPRHAHYDWVTTMGINETDGEKKWFAFNLTRNQSIDQDKYNENLIWFENETSLLPPVTFERSVPTKEFKDGAVWKIKDKHDMVNIEFTVYDIVRSEIFARPFVNVEYYVAFGELNGYVRDESGKKYILDGMMGMGEDKTMLF